MNPGDTITLALAAETTLTVTVPSGASGTLTRLSDQPGGGDPSAPTVLNGADVTVAATGSPRRYMIACSAGAISYSAAAADPSLPMTVLSTDGSGSTTAISGLGYNYDGGLGNVILTSSLGGYVRVNPSVGTDGAPGPIQLIAADSADPTGGNGAGVTLQGGNGNVAGGGGRINIYGGSGATDGAGGDGPGGDILLSPGTRGGVTGRNGLVIFDPDMLPTADPHVNGAAWNSAGTLKISAG